MNKFCRAVALFSLFIPVGVHAEQSVEPDKQTAIQVSNRYINRFVCPGAMQDLIYSKEKDITGRFSGSDAFIKFKIHKIGNEKRYASADNELFLVCDGNVYNVIAKPKKMPSVTVRLMPPKGDDLKKNIAAYKNMPLEKQALHIIREASDGNYPSTYKIDSFRKTFKLNPGYSTILHQTIEVEGVGLRLKDFEITSTSQSDEIKVEEKDFLSSSISPSILAVAVVDHTLRPREKTHVFVVERKEAL